MTSDERVEATLSASGVPIARLTWGPSNPPLPYATYQERPHSIFADDGNYAGIPRYSAYLHTNGADEEVCEAFAARISELGCYLRHPTEIENGHFVHRYDFSVTRRAE